MQKKPSKRTTIKKRKRETLSKPVPNTKNTILLFVGTHGSYEHYGSRFKVNRNNTSNKNNKFMSFRVHKEENDTISINGKPTPFVNIQRIKVVPPGIVNETDDDDYKNIEKNITSLMRKKHQINDNTDLVELVKDQVMEGHISKKDIIKKHKNKKDELYNIDEFDGRLPIVEKSFLLLDIDYKMKEATKRANAKLDIKGEGLNYRIKAVTDKGVLKEEFMNEYHQMKPDYKMNNTFPTVYLSKLIKSIGQFCKENPKLSDITNLIIIDFTCSDNHFETVNYEEALKKKKENPEVSMNTKSMNTKYHLGEFNETIFVDRDSKSNSNITKKSKSKKSKGRQFNETVKSRFGGRTRKTKGKTK